MLLACQATQKIKELMRQDSCYLYNYIIMCNICFGKTNPIGAEGGQKGRASELSCHTASSPAGHLGGAAAAHGGRTFAEARSIGKASEPRIGPKPRTGPPPSASLRGSRRGPQSGPDQPQFRRATKILDGVPQADSSDAANKPSAHGRHLAREGSHALGPCTTAAARPLASIGTP